MTVMGVFGGGRGNGSDSRPWDSASSRPKKESWSGRRVGATKDLSLKFILRSYFVQGSFLALSCYATYYYMGWTAGLWHPSQGIHGMPATPANLNFALSSQAYLQSLTAYFFPTVTTQMANALCKRSWSASLFSKDFLAPARRQELLDAIALWRPARYSPQVKISYHVTGFGRGQAIKATLNLLRALAVLPVKFTFMLLIRLATLLETPERGCRCVAFWLDFSSAIIFFSISFLIH